MSIIVSTNLQALKIQNSLSSATTSMNTAMTRMSTGYKINSAKDDAAGMAISTILETKISGTTVAAQNAQIGSNLLTTSEDTLNVMKTNVSRIRDLVEQAANGTYDKTSKTAIRTEVKQRIDEIDRLATGTDFNGIKLFDSSTGAAGDLGINLQIGTGTATATNVINLDKSLFTNATSSALGFTSAAINLVLGNDSGTGASGLSSDAAALLTQCDTALGNISTRKTNIGAYQNRLTSAIDTLGVQKTNLAAANSTIKDADIATESAEYVKQQILQSASASLLASANTQPQLALQLIKG